MSQGQYIDRAKLQEMEAALVQQIESKACTNMVKEVHHIKGEGYKDWQRKCKYKYQKQSFRGFWKNN